MEGVPGYAKGPGLGGTRITSLAVFQRQMLGDKCIQHNVEVSNCLPSPGGECPPHGILGRDADLPLVAVKRLRGARRKRAPRSLNSATSFGDDDALRHAPETAHKMNAERQLCVPQSSPSVRADLRH